jgi:hypothetical protein
MMFDADPKDDLRASDILTSSIGLHNNYANQRQLSRSHHQGPDTLGGSIVVYPIYSGAHPSRIRNINCIFFIDYF